jgi:acetyl-CoA C-acetyltransferase
MSDPIVIVSAVRTPMGAFQGDFATLAAHDLGGVAIRAAVQRAGISPDVVNEVLFGNCLMAGQGQAPARQAGFKCAVVVCVRSCLLLTCWRQVAPRSLWLGVWRA